MGELNDDKPVVEWLWIAENKPDRFSGLIQWFFNTPYSHCAIRYIKTGMIWHATIGDEPSKCGVIEEAPADALAGCHIAATLTEVLDCTHEEFESFLESERGKPYAHRGNVGLVLDRMFVVFRPVVSIFTSQFRKPANAERNCSEFAGVVYHKFVKRLKGRRDKWTPPLLEKWLRPRRLV